jgi:phage virion morphogenesis protein
MPADEILTLDIISKRAHQRLRRLAGNLGDLRPAYREVLNVMHRSVMRNFDEGGRRPKWKKRKRDYPWPILQKTKRLRRSISKRFEGGAPVLRTRVPYAEFHQFGAPRANLPARPFLVIRREDRQQIRQILERHYGKGVTR